MAGTRSVRAPSTLLERGPELARIDQLIAAAQAGDGRFLVVEARSGIGKTALLAEARGRAHGAGLATCSARGSELEKEFAFGVVRQLFEPAVRKLSEEERSGLFVGAAALAAPVMGQALEQVPDGLFAALHGLYWLAADLAARHPVLLAVDDAHWADQPSLRWLVYLLHRLEALPILVVVTTRARQTGPQGNLLTSLTAEPGVELMRLEPLGEVSVATLVEGAFGTAPDARFSAACHRVTAGNPLALRAVIHDLVGQGVRPTAAAATALDEQVPVAIARSVLARLADLGDPPLRLARALAVLGDGTELRSVARLAGLSPQSASEAADQLATADVLARGRPPRFVHPLLRAAIHDDIPPGLLAQLHSQAAGLLAGLRADPEAVAAHLLRCDPADQPGAVEGLRAAARLAQRRGAPETAVAYLERALAETAEEAPRSTVLAELGRTELLGGDHRAAAGHLREAVAACTDPVTRGHVRNDLADAVRAEGDRSLSLQLRLQALEDLGDRDPEASERIRVRASVPLFTTRQFPPPGEGPIEHLRGLAAGSGPLARQARLALGWLLALHGEPAEQVRELIDRGLDGGAFLVEETSDAPAAFWAALALLYTDELGRARRLGSEMQANAAARGSMIGFATGSLVRAIANLRGGLLADAEADFRETLDVTQPRDLVATVATAHLADTFLQLGRTELARAQIERVELAPAMLDDISGAWVLAARGRVWCGLGEKGTGMADLRSCGEFAEHLGMVSPLCFPWRSNLATNLAARSPEEARHLAESDLDVAQRTGIPCAVGVALRTAAALRPDREAIDLLAGAVASLDSSPAILERARALLDLGAALRRLGRRIDARAPLREALDIAASSGAALLAEQAREEAILAGGRPRRPRLSGLEALTPAELRAARLAAEGRSNREIAEALFITAKTVGDHLGRVYAKLEIDSRTALAAILGGHGAAGMSSQP